MYALYGGRGVTVNTQVCGTWNLGSIPNDRPVKLYFGIGGSFEPEIPVGESEITSSVEIIYEIR